MLDGLFERAQHIPVWILSLGNAVVTLEELEAKMTRLGRQTRAIEIKYQHLPAVATAATKLQIEHTKTHDLRRTYANEVLLLLRERGMSDEEALEKISELLGHGRSRMEKGLLGSYIRLDRLHEFRPAGSSRPAADEEDKDRNGGAK